MVPKLHKLNAAPVVVRLRALHPNLVLPLDLSPRREPGNRNAQLPDRQRRRIGSALEAQVAL